MLGSRRAPSSSSRRAPSPSRRAAVSSSATAARCPPPSQSASPVSSTAARRPVHGDYASELAPPVRCGQRLSGARPQTARRSSTTSIPGVAKLDPALLDALRRAATDAAARRASRSTSTAAGVRRTYQEQLLRAGGHEVRLGRGGCPMGGHPRHVRARVGERGRPRAVQPRRLAVEHGATYGLCQIYRNEPWHYELRPEAVDHGCPPMYADPYARPATARTDRARSAGQRNHRTQGEAMSRTTTAAGRPCPGRPDRARAVRAHRPRACAGNERRQREHCP